MDTTQFLEKLVSLPGVSGDETAVAKAVAEAFQPYVDTIRTDKMGNVDCVVGTGSPKVMVAAHMDEIGMMVTDITKEGFLRMTRVGGVNHHILPALEVIVHGEKELYGVVGMAPPHITDPADRTKPVPMEKLYVDVGLSEEKVRELVTIGDMITMKTPLLRLNGTMIASKTVDDRACIAAMYYAAEILSKRKYTGEVHFVNTVQEEVGTRGAITSSYAINPDIGIAFDVCHAKQPGAKPQDVFAPDKVVITMGPNIHPGLFKRLKAVADSINIPYEVEPCPRPTSTDARAIQMARDGVPTLLISMPVKYMHTSVELVDMNTVNNAGKLLAAFLADMDNWEEWLCF